MIHAHAKYIRLRSKVKKRCGYYVLSDKKLLLSIESIKEWGVFETRKEKNWWLKLNNFLQEQQT